MIKKILTVLTLVLANTFLTPFIHSSSIIPVIEKFTGQNIWDPVKHFGVGQEKEQLFHEVSSELNELESTNEQFSAQNEAQIAEVQNELTAVKAQIEQYPESTTLTKQLSILNETYQLLKDTVRLREQLRTLLTRLSKSLASFLQDPDLATYKKEQKLVDRLYYSFQDLEKIHEKILDQSKTIGHLSEQEKNTKTELENHKRIAAATQEEHKKVQEKLINTSSIPATLYQRQFSSESGNNKIITHLEERLYTIKKNNNNLQVRELKKRLEFNAFSLFIAKTELELLKQYLQKIKPSVRVSDADILHEHDEFNKWKIEYYQKRDQLRHTVEELNERYRQKEEQTAQLSKRLNIPISTELTKWTKEPVKNMRGYINLITVAYNNTELNVTEEEKELQEARLMLEDELFTYKTVQIQAEETYQKIASRKISSDEELNKEVRTYETIAADAKAKEGKYREKITQISDLISIKKATIENIGNLKSQIERNAETLFKHNTSELEFCTETLQKSDALLQKQLEVLSNLAGIYSAMMSPNGNTQRIASFIKSELESITIWRRSEKAINWQGITDSFLFLSDVYSYAIHFSFTSLANQIKHSFSSPLMIFIILIKYILFLLALLFVYRNIPQFISRLLLISHTHTGAITYFSILLIGILSFLKTYFSWIAPWVICLSLFMILPTLDAYLYALFLLCSIPYLLILARYLMVFMVQFNALHNYLLFPKPIKNRLIPILTLIMYSTIIQNLFKYSFLLVSYYKSELPTILIAINSIIISLSPIFLISREQIIGYLSNDDRMGRWLRAKINANYYLLVIIAGATIIMINPYVGFGHLVSHVLLNVLYTCGLLLVILWTYTKFKEIVSRIFFFTELDVTRERFINAKVWFGLIIIASFIVTIFVGIVATARIWGWQIHMADFMALLYEPLIGKGTTNPITFASLIQIVGFVFAGFLISYAINSIVLDKIFDLLVVDAGVQYAVTRIAQYIIITIAIFIGFHSVGLGQLIGLMLGAFAFSLGWVLKEPVSDFAAYFMILIQRPIKIGDYIELDDEIRGVVRKITPRSVLLRKKNSTMMVVPNSIMTSRPINNWNYTRNFTAFNDITIFIPYKEDPVFVKKLLHKAVDSHPNVLKNPPSVVRLESFGEHGYEFMIRGHISPVYTLEQWNIASDVRLVIIKLLRENNIQIALPVRIIEHSTPPEKRT